MYEAKEEKREEINAEIRCLVSQLAAPTSSIGDWKIIKCYEAKLKEEELPYDLDALTAERQTARDKINELQAQLETLEAS